MEIKETRVERSKKRRKAKRNKFCKKFVLFLVLLVFLFGLKQVNIAMCQLMMIEERKLFSFDLINLIAKMRVYFQKAIFKMKYFIERII